jgi:hypothetical protein
MIGSNKMTHYVARIRIPEKRQLIELKPGDLFLLHNELWVLIGHTQDDDNRTSGCQRLAFTNINGWRGEIREPTYKRIDETQQVQIVHGIF